MALAVKVRVVLEAELHSPAYDCLAVNHPVSFRDNHSVYASWCAFSRGPVVFCCLSYNLYLFWGEPLCQSMVVSDDHTRVHVMVVPSVHKSEIMACRGRQEHVFVYWSKPDMVDVLLRCNPLVSALKKMHRL